MNPLRRHVVPEILVWKEPPMYNAKEEAADQKRNPNIGKIGTKYIIRDHVLKNSAQNSTSIRVSDMRNHKQDWTIAEQKQPNHILPQNGIQMSIGARNKKGWAIRNHYQRGWNWNYQELKSLSSTSGSS